MIYCPCPLLRCGPGSSSSSNTGGARRGYNRNTRSSFIWMKLLQQQQQQQNVGAARCSTNDSPRRRRDTPWAPTSGPHLIRLAPPQAAVNGAKAMIAPHRRTMGPQSCHECTGLVTLPYREPVSGLTVALMSFQRNGGCKWRAAATV